MRIIQTKFSVITVSVVLLSILCAFQALLTVSHNDNMYFTSLFNPCISYECNGFVQMPYYFFLKLFIPLFIFLKIDLYLGYKLLSIVTHFLTIFFLYKLYKKHLDLKKIFLIISLNSIALSSSFEIGNYAYTYFFLILSFYLINEKQKFFLSGIVLGTSIGFKISSILFVPVLFFYAWNNKWKFIIGLILSLIPISFWFNEYFLLNNFEFHSKWTPIYRNNYFSYLDVKEMSKVLLKIIISQILNKGMIVFNTLLIFTTWKLLSRSNYLYTLKNNIVLIILFLTCLGVPLVAKTVYPQYLIPLNLLFVIFIVCNLNINKALFSLILLASFIQNIYLTKNTLNGGFFDVLKIRKELRSLHSSEKITEDIFSFSGIFTSGISTFTSLQDSGIFYPRIGETLETLEFLDFNNYYKTLIYPHKNLENLPGTILFGFYHSHPSEKILVESYSTRFETKTIQLQNSFRGNSISLLVKQGLDK